MSSVWENDVKLNSANVLQIRLGGRGLTDEQMSDMALFVDKILKPPEIKNVFANTIELSENQIGSKGLIALLNVLERHEVQVKCLKLYKNRIGDEGAFRLGELLKKQIEPMEELHLSHNQLTGLALVSLCLVIHRHKYQAYPFRSRSSMAFIPMWLRVENNNISNPTLCLDLLKKEANVRMCPADNRDICGPWKCRHEQMQKDKGVPTVHLFAVGNMGHRPVRPGSDTENALRDLIRKSATVATRDATKAKAPAILNNASTASGNVWGIPGAPKSGSAAGYPKGSGGTSTTSAWGASEPEQVATQPVSSEEGKVDEEDDAKDDAEEDAVVDSFMKEDDAKEEQEEKTERSERDTKSQVKSAVPQSTPLEGVPSSTFVSKNKIHVAQLVSESDAFLCPLCQLIAPDPVITVCSHIFCPECFQHHLDKTTMAAKRAGEKVTAIPCPHPDCEKHLGKKDVMTLESSANHSEAAVLTILRRMRANQQVRCIHHTDLFCESFGGKAEAVKHIVKCEYIGDMTSILKHQKACLVQKYIDNPGAALLEIGATENDEASVTETAKADAIKTMYETKTKPSEDKIGDKLENQEEPEQEQQPNDPDDDEEVAYGELYRCIFDFEPQGQGQLRIRAGDMLVIYDRCDSGWAVGHKFDMETQLPVGTPGWFPEAYSEPAPPL